MQSKTSFCENFSKMLFRKNLLRFWPLWAAPSFIGALFPLAMLTQLVRYGRDGLFGTQSALEFAGMYYSVVSYALPIISLCYAILVAVAVWSYLFNNRSVGMMHTLPVRREGLFLTGVLSGMTMMAIPYAVTGALCILISLCYGFFEPVSVLVTILAVIGESLFYFASATVVAFITGNLFALPVLYFIFHFLAVGMDALVNTFANGFIFGLNGTYTGVVEFLSPTVYLINQVRADHTYVERFEPDPVHGYMTEHGVGYMHSELTDVSLEGGWLIAVYALAGLVLLGLAYALYRRRRSESAGDVVAVGWMKPIFRYGVSICGSMLGGLVLYTIFWGTFQRGDYYDVIPLLVAMLVAGAISYYAASMLLAKSLRVFRNSWKGLGITALCAAAICGVLYFDVFGVETRVPPVDQIESMTFRAAENYYDLTPEEDAELMEAIRGVHLAIAEDADYIKAMDLAVSEIVAEGTEYSRYNSVRINYFLKNGTSVQRRYSVPMTRERLQTPGTYDQALDALVNGEAMKAKRFHLADDFAAYEGSIYLEALNEGSVNFGNREAQRIMEAVELDIALGTCGTYRWFEEDSYETSHASDYALDLNLGFQKPVKMADGTTSYDYDNINIRVRPEMTNTVNALLELGLATKDTLKTRLELYPQDYDQAYWEYQDKYGHIDYEVYKKMGLAASVGIIGGADGPTEVVVAEINRNPNSSSLYVS